MTTCLRCAALLLGIVSYLQPCGADDSPAQGRLDRSNLLIYRDSDGTVRPVQSAADWQKRRAMVLAGMTKIMGPLPGDEKRCPLALEIEEEVDCGKFVRRQISYAAEPGGRVPAYLLVPKKVLDGKHQAPAILCPHPTHLELGPRTVVGLGAKNDMPYARELAERGYVCLAPCYPRMGGYEPDLEKLGYQSTTMKAIWDNIRGIDLLESFPWVQRGGVGAVGHSLGGHNTVYTAVFDERIKVAVTSCGLDSYVDYKNGDIRGWTSKWYMPRLLEFRDRLPEIPFDFHEMVGALAPRHCFINAPLNDDNFKWRSVDEVGRAAAQVYRLHDVPERLRIEHPDCPHDFPPAMRELAYQLFDQVLRAAKGKIGELPGTAGPRIAPIELTLVDDHAIGYGTFQSHNQKVVSNDHGIFMTHIRQANKEYTAQTWRLSRSTDGGKSFATVYEATNATSSPALETDEQGTVFALRPDYVDGHAYVYRFAPPDYREPVMTRIPGGSAGKYCAAFDAGRRQLYYLAHNQEFRVINFEGTILRSTTLFKPGPHAAVQYPHLSVAADGTLFAAWTTSAPDRYLYWDIHAMRSPDGGATWQTLAGAPLELPIVADDTGPADRISLDDEFEVHSWLSAFLARNGKLHLVYWAKNSPQRQHYVRYDAASGKREIDREPLLAGWRLAEPNDSAGLIAGRGAANSPLYCVTTVDDRKRLACVFSADNGASWRDFALGAETFPFRVYAIGAARETTRDGWIIGTFTDVKPEAKLYTEAESGKVYFFRIRAD
ncbi:MAG: prolyl oligopeptidase family serine peptidase [Planctomycetia bacterium]|nr:prolyl oligopeptidase family serine peptidase [Planctomycetia bacterium]